MLAAVLIGALLIVAVLAVSVLAVHDRASRLFWWLVVAAGVLCVGLAVVLAVGA